MSKRSKAKNTLSSEVLQSSYSDMLFPIFKTHRMLVSSQLPGVLKLAEYTEAVELLEKAAGAGIIVKTLKGDKEGKFQYFFCAPDFYSTKELLNLVTLEFCSEMARCFFPRKAVNAEDLAIRLFNDSRGAGVMTVLLMNFVDCGLLSRTKKGIYKLTHRGREFGLDKTTITALNKLEKEFISVETGSKEFSSLEEMNKILTQEIGAKSICAPRKVVGHDERVSMAFLCETMFGSQFTDVALIQSWLNYCKDNAVKYDCVVETGLIQGTFDGSIQQDRRRGLSTGLGSATNQFKASGVLTEQMEALTNMCVIVQGDDDYRYAMNTARLQQLVEGKNWGWGHGGNLTAEQNRRRYIAEFYRKLKTQYEIIIPYMYCVGRTLLNAEEVFQKIKIFKTEYRLIMEILQAQKHRFEYPDCYKEVVQIDALNGKLNKRWCSPNSVMLDFGNKQRMLISHNPVFFSDVTMYQNPSLMVDFIRMVSANAGSKTMPKFIVGGHQEQLWVTRVTGKNGSWVIQLPGLQNVNPASFLELKYFHDKINTSKHTRHVGVRRIPPSPGILRLENIQDGRIRFNLYNQRVAEVIETNKHLPPETVTMAYISDTQFGSITMCPEHVVKAMDYMLYERKANFLGLNGDIIHGFNYPQIPQENAPLRLVSVDAQQEFALALMEDLIVQAPDLYKVAVTEGNHEWNTIGAKYAGPNYARIFEDRLLGHIHASQLSGGSSRIALKSVETVNRFRWNPETSHNPGGDVVYAPVWFGNLAGFGVCMSHLFQLKQATRGAGSSPLFQMMSWIRGIAAASKHVDLLIGGHYHSPHITEVAGKICIVSPGAATQSGFETLQGMMSQLGFVMLQFSNRHGITVEYIPWEFLDNCYTLQSPAFKGKEKLLRRPRVGESGYKRGAFSPYIEELIDKIHNYHNDNVL